MLGGNWVLMLDLSNVKLVVDSVVLVVLSLIWIRLVVGMLWVVI